MPHIAGIGFGNGVKLPPRLSAHYELAPNGSICAVSIQKNPIGCDIDICDLNSDY